MIAFYKIHIISRSHVLQHFNRLRATINHISQNIKRIIL